MTSTECKVPICAQAQHSFIVYTKMIYTFKKLSLFGDFNHFNQTFWGENSITAMLLFIFTSLTHPSYPFLESHKLLIIYLVTSRQLPDLCHNDLKETPRCSPGLLINLCKEIPDFTLRLTYHLPTGERRQRTVSCALTVLCPFCSPNLRCEGILSHSS